tara:strand:- start:7031 stop:8143 length:1113 start_codon:yes stop_codon:yes gene_type:complete
MLVGVPKEIKKNECRVGLTPSSVYEVTCLGHQVLVETNAGHEIGFEDADYKEVGATIASSAKEVFDKADLIVKVKEPQPEECKMLRKGQVLFTFLHLAPDPVQTELLQESGCIAIAYETITDAFGGLPLLSPMSEVAGRMSIQAGAKCLEKISGGSGKLLGGVPGVAPADVVVLGGGVVGTNAIRMALGMEANVTVIDRSLKRLRELDSQYGSALNTIYSTTHNISTYVKNADLVIGAVLIPGANAPKLVTEEMVKTMARGSVLVDVAIDQGGCFETSRATTHEDPIYIKDEVVHYCVANMPGACAKTAAIALNNATLPYLLNLITKGVREALLEDAHFLNGLNVCNGKITYKAVADAFNKEYVSPIDVL